MYRCFTSKQAPFVVEARNRVIPGIDRAEDLAQEF
jgi:hypothetical protein